MNTTDDREDRWECNSQLDMVG